MKILRLVSENIKRLSVVEITPDGNLVQITGKNGAGKTSCLDSIWYALGGQNVIPAEPIRRGAESARIELTLGSGDKIALIVERTFTKTNSYLKVRTEDGAAYQKPQRMIEDLLGALTFDPLAFMRSSAKEQFKILRDIVELPVDLDGLDKKRAELFETRTETNREVKSLQAQVDAIAVPEGCPDAPADTAEIVERLARVDAENAAIRDEAQRREMLARRAAAARDNVEKIKKELERAQSDHKAAVEESDRAAAAALRPLADPQAIKAELAAAEERNRLVEKRAQRARLQRALETARDGAADATRQIEAIESQKIAALAAVDMPVDGLSFGDGVVIYNDLPLDQASDAEQLKISTAIAAALNPKLRVIRIRDGSLLDSDSLKWLAEFAKDKDYQCWLEMVGEGGPGQIIMEDGHVKGADAVEQGRTNAAPNT